MFFPNGFEALTHSARWRWLGAEPVGGRALTPVAHGDCNCVLGGITSAHMHAIGRLGDSP